MLYFLNTYKTFQYNDSASFNILSIYESLIFYKSAIIFIISLSVSFIPSRDSLPILRIVFSTPLHIIPSPPLNSHPLIYIYYPKIPASTLEAILAAQDGFAPSQTIPDTIANPLTRV